MEEQDETEDIPKSPFDKLRHPKKRAMLLAFEETGAIGRAAKAAGVHRSVHSLWMKNDSLYAEAFAEATEQAGENLETEARQRAIKGLAKLRLHNGEIVMVRRKFIDPDCPESEKESMVPFVEHEVSDTLLIFLLKGAMPHKYKERFESTSTFTMKQAAQNDMPEWLNEPATPKAG